MSEHKDIDEAERLVQCGEPLLHDANQLILALLRELRERRAAEALPNRKAITHAIRSQISGVINPPAFVSVRLDHARAILQLLLPSPPESEAANGK